MNNDQFNPGSPISDTLTKYPQTITVFMDHKMICVGCSMASFDSLEDAARNYAIPVELFLQELSAAVSSAPSIE